MHSCLSYEIKIPKICIGLSVNDEHLVNVFHHCFFLSQATWPLAILSSIFSSKPENLLIILAISINLYFESLSA